jgi:hypothetical protein
MINFTGEKFAIPVKGDQEGTIRWVTVEFLEQTGPNQEFFIEGSFLTTKAELYQCIPQLQKERGVMSSTMNMTDPVLAFARSLGIIEMQKFIEEFRVKCPDPTSPQ